MNNLSFLMIDLQRLKCKPSWRNTTEIGCVVDAALPRVTRHLRVGAEWTCAHDLVVDYATRHHRGWSRALFHPVDHRRHGIVAIRTDAAATVSHTRNHKEAG